MSRSARQDSAVLNIDRRLHADVGAYYQHRLVNVGGDRVIEATLQNWADIDTLIYGELLHRVEGITKQKDRS